MGRRKHPLKGKGTLLAVAAVLGLSAWVYFAERGPVIEPGHEPPVSALIGMKADDVVRVEVKGEGPALVLTRPQSAIRNPQSAISGWQIEQPIRARADDSQVSQLVKDFVEIGLSRTVTLEGGDVKAYGLDKPQVTIALTDKSGKRRVIEVGKKHPAETSSLYARVAGEPRVFMLSSFTVDSVKNKRPDDLRDKTVLAFDREKTARLTIEKPKGTLVAERKGTDAWELAQPARAPADKDAVSGLLSIARDLRVEKFFPEKPTDPEKYGLKPAQLTLTVTGQDGKSASLLLGKAAPDPNAVYAMRAGDTQLFSVRKSALQDLGKDATQLRDKTLLSFKRDDLQRLAITNPAGSLELQRDGQDWKATKPFQGKAKKEKLENLFYTLEAVKGTRAVEDKPKNLARYGLDKPQVQVSVWLKGESAPKELLIGRQSATNKDYFAKSTAQDAVFTVPEFVLNGLKVKPADLKG